MRLRDNGVNISLTDLKRNDRRDYVETGVNLTYTRTDGKNVDVHDYVVEVAIVCDKEWSAKFQNDRQQILNFWTVHYWDINMRYKTLPSSNISFVITSITIITSTDAQPFIEESRNEEGIADLGRILGRFGDWVWGQTDALPKFDMAVCVTGAKLEWYGGLAYVRGACQRKTGSLVYDDDANFNSVDVAAHEIGHNLGAPHDTDDNYPGGCSSVGYIMGGNHDGKRYFFSECSDRTIKDYVTSDQAACLQQKDEPSEPIISPGFESVVAPDMDEQCRAWMHNPEAVVGRENWNCSKIICWNGPIGYYMRPIDNSPCLYGRCFRGRCLPSMSLLENVASGECLLGSDRFSSDDKALMSPCPVQPTPLDQFYTIRGQRGRWLMMPYATQEATENEDKCLQGSNEEGGEIRFRRCLLQTYEWQLNELNDGQFLIRDAETQKCLKQEGSSIRTVSNCNENDATMKWRISISNEMQ